jgi:hypothetical protein
MCRGLPPRSIAHFQKLFLPPSSVANDGETPGSARRREKWKCGNVEMWKKWIARRSVTSLATPGHGWHQIPHRHRQPNKRPPSEQHPATLKSIPLACLVSLFPAGRPRHARPLSTSALPCRAAPTLTSPFQVRPTLAHTAHLRSSSLAALPPCSPCVTLASCLLSASRPLGLVLDRHPVFPLSTIPSACLPAP